MARGHPPPHCENTQVLREAITEDDDVWDFRGRLEHGEKRFSKLIIGNVARIYMNIGENMPVFFV